MSLYPDSPRPASPYPFRLNRPFLSGGPEWATQDRYLTSFDLMESDLNYRGKTWAQAMTTLGDFWRSVGGAAGRFTFVDFNGAGIPGTGVNPGVAWTDLFVAKGDGVGFSWDLPTFAIAASPAPKIYENGTEKTSEIVSIESDPAYLYHIISGTGTDGVDALVYGIPSTVATAPSPATSGTSLVLHAGDGAHCPATPFFANVWPTATDPIGLDDPAGRTANIETIQVTGRTTDTLTIVRARNGTLARSIVIGDQFAVAPPATVLITIGATCRRAFRRAKFAAAKNPFTLNVPANYYQGPITIVEVQK